MWSTLQKRLNVVLPRGHTIVPTTSADCDAFEQRRGVLLPHSYRCFLDEIGAGTLRHYFHIAAPTRARGVRGLHERIREAQGNPLLADIYSDPALVARMIPFADTSGGDTIVWDPDRKRGKSRLEYEVLVLPRDGRRILPLAKDFRAFIQDAVFGRTFEELVCGAVESEWEVEYSFLPVAKRQRKAGSVKR